MLYTIIYGIGLTIDPDIIIIIIVIAISFPSWALEGILKRLGL